MVECQTTKRIILKQPDVLSNWTEVSCLSMWFDRVSYSVKLNLFHSFIKFSIKLIIIINVALLWESEDMEFIRLSGKTSLSTVIIEAEAF